MLVSTDWKKTGGEVEEGRWREEEDGGKSFNIVVSLDMGRR